ncbi:MAG: hypothetical protein ACTSQL_07660 [Promethearchaeota archaeon]
MDYIKGRCFTNLDDYDCSDTSSFVAVPKIGDGVEVKFKGMRRVLYVVEITHCMSQPIVNIDVKGKPYIRVELHKRNQV